MRSLEFYCNNEMECEFVSKRETRKCGKVAEKKRRRGKWYDLYLYDGMMEVRNAESVAIMRWNMSCPRETAEKLLVERTWVAG